MYKTNIVQTNSVYLAQSGTLKYLAYFIPSEPPDVEFCIVQTHCINWHSSDTVYTHGQVQKHTVYMFFLQSFYQLLFRQTVYIHCIDHKHFLYMTLFRQSVHKFQTHCIPPQFIYIVYIYIQLLIGHIVGTWHGIVQKHCMLGLVQNSDTLYIRHGSDSFYFIRLFIYTVNT